ncbi:hypothetical protein VF21_06215 [Pseudogymnoascus sp. 05NY08]|nr:hypothetical protein VF21_06215 [Pseudogymnoascus sp. 05NY08]
MAPRNPAVPPAVAQILLAGGAAGGIESILTYPTEYVKTQQQLLRKTAGVSTSPLKLFIDIVRTQGFKPLYGGAGAFCVSNASKSAVRFFTFDFTQRYLPVNPTTGRTTPAGNILAGLAAGIAESIAVVTPGETLKTKLIDDRNRVGGPQYKNAVSGIRSILATEGVPGFYRGVVAVTLKQASNAVVRFTSYNFLLDQTKAMLGDTRNAACSMIAGAGAGLITVYCTMPMDNIKTKLQSIGSRERYSGSWDCVKKMVSGAISFAVYEQVLVWTSKLPGLDIEEKTPALS